MLLILVSLCGLISCVSQHKHLLVHLSCHSITKTKQGLSRPRADALLLLCAGARRRRCSAAALRGPPPAADALPLLCAGARHARRPPLPHARRRSSARARTAASSCRARR